MSESLPTCFCVDDSQISSSTFATHLGIEEIFIVVEKLVATLRFAETEPPVGTLDLETGNACWKKEM